MEPIAADWPMYRQVRRSACGHLQFELSEPKARKGRTGGLQRNEKATMSIVYRIEEERGIAFVLWDGMVTGDEWLRHVRRLIVDPKWPPAQALHLSDLRSARIDGSINTTALQEAAALFGSNERIAGLKAAIVAGDAYVQARIFEDLIAQHRGSVIAFNSLGPACAWLGVETGHAEQALEELRRSTHHSP